MQAVGGGPPSPSPVGASLGQKRPAILGDFEIRREIGRGGMGTVYEAWQRSLKRMVALKVLASHAGAAPTAVERFLRESQAAAKLHHTHIVPIFAQGEDQGVYYYAMELVEGRTLSAIIASAHEHQIADTATAVARTSADLAETIELTRTPSEVTGEAELPRKPDAGSPPEGDGSAVVLSDPLGICSASERFAAIAGHIANVADALEYAHQHGVIHRDIKPPNLMLGDDGRLRIADFGLARLLEQPGVTITGEMLGSPMYMSPEQILQGPSRIDARTDLYSLGVTLYEWLTLKPPFPGETRESVIRLILTADPLPLRAHNLEIPVALETICVKAIERDVDKRYQTAAALRDDLRRFLANKPIMARRAGILAHTRRFLRRHQVAALLGAAAVFAVVLGGALLLQQSRTRTQTIATHDARAEAASALARAQEAIAEADELMNMLRSVLPAEVGALARGAGVAAPMVQDLLRSQVGGTSAADVVKALAVGTPAGIARRAALTFYEMIAPGDWPPGVSSADDGFGTMLRRAVALRETDPEVALQLVEDFVQARPDDYEARQLHAALAAQLGKYETLARDGEELVRLRSDQPNGYIWAGLAMLLLQQAGPSVEEFARAAELEGLRAWAQSLRGLALLQMGRAKEAIQAFDTALEEAPDLVFARLGRAAAHARAGNLLKAVDELTHVIELRPEDSSALTMRGDYHSALGRFAEAAQDFERAIDIVGYTTPLVLRLVLARSQQQKQPVSDMSPAPPAPETRANTGTSLPVEGS